LCLTFSGIVVSTAAASGIPVGIAVARQRLQHHQETSSTSMRNVSLSHHTSHHASYHHFQPDNL
ncbi:GSCOCG00000701001-RA-CDS, partial [Cotesia congregata]